MISAPQNNRIKILKNPGFDSNAAPLPPLSIDMRIVQNSLSPTKGAEVFIKRFFQFLCNIANNQFADHFYSVLQELLPNSLMSTKSLYSGFLILAALVWSCADRTDHQVTYSGLVQGTTFMIRYFGEGDTLAMFRQIDSVFELVDRTASLYDSGSMISRVNAGEDIEVNDVFVTLLNRSNAISAETGGAFDATVGPLVRGWGFYRKKGMDLPSSTVDSLKRFIGYKNVVLEGRKVIKRFPGVLLDFNAIAQGFTVDLVALLFEKRGIRNYLVEIGGEVRAAGKKAGNTPWIIGIERPAENDSAAQVVQQRIMLEGMSAATSGNYRKFFEQDGKKYAHTIDPSTGYPVQHNLLSVTILADDCMSADAYATACMVMGVERSLEFLKRHPGTEGYFISTGPSGKLAFNQTPGFSRFVD